MQPFPVAAAYDDGIGVVHRRLEKMFRRFAELSERGGIRVQVPFEDGVELLQEAIDQDLLVL